MTTYNATTLLELADLEAGPNTLDPEYVDASRRVLACWDACEGLSTESLERNAKLIDLLRQALDCLENHVMQRTYAGGVVISNTAIALRERLKEKT